MAAPRDVMRETQEFEAMRDALRRAITPDGEATTSGAAKPPRGPPAPKAPPPLIRRRPTRSVRRNQVVGRRIVEEGRARRTLM